MASIVGEASQPTPAAYIHVLRTKGARNQVDSGRQRLKALIDAWVSFMLMLNMYTRTGFTRNLGSSLLLYVADLHTHTNRSPKLIPPCPCHSSQSVLDILPAQCHNNTHEKEHEPQQAHWVLRHLCGHV